jgi:IS1 family transposase
MNFNLNRKTVFRKFRFLATQARLDLLEKLNNHPPSESILFDEMLTWEHTKCKPIAIPIAITHDRRVLDFDVASMAANGPLAAISRKKYGKRLDETSAKRRAVLERVKKHCTPYVEIKTDRHRCYPREIKEILPHAVHKAYKGKRGCVTGQGELKKAGHDPLFMFNHTAAMFRANINRLFRKTWCTTKKMERLADHIAIYVQFHNDMIERQKAKKALRLINT